MTYRLGERLLWPCPSPPGPLDQGWCRLRPYRSRCRFLVARNASLALPFGRDG